MNLKSAFYEHSPDNELILKIFILGNVDCNCVQGCHGLHFRVVKTDGFAAKLRQRTCVAFVLNQRVQGHLSNIPAFGSKASTMGLSPELLLVLRAERCHGVMGKGKFSKI